MDDQNQTNQPFVPGTTPVVPSVPEDITPVAPVVAPAMEPITPPTPWNTPAEPVSMPTPSMEPTPTPEEPVMPVGKPKKKILPVIGGVLALLLVVGVAGAAYYVSNQLSTRQAVSPNAPESKPMAAVTKTCSWSGDDCVDDKDCYEGYQAGNPCYDAWCHTYASGIKKCVGAEEMSCQSWYWGNCHEKCGETSKKQLQKCTVEGVTYTREGYGGKNGNGGEDCTDDNECKALVCPAEKRDAKKPNTITFTQAGTVRVFTWSMNGKLTLTPSVGTPVVMQSNATSSDPVQLLDTPLEVTAGQTYTIKSELTNEGGEAYGWIPNQPNNICGPVIWPAKSTTNGCGEKKDISSVINEANGDTNIQSIYQTQCWGDKLRGDATQDYDFNDFAIVFAYEKEQEFTLVKKAYRNETTNNPGNYGVSDEIIAGQTVSPDEVFVYYLDIDTNPPVATVNVLDNLPPEVIFVDSQNWCSYAAANHSVVCNNVPLNGAVGFIAFRVKVKSGVADGTIIHNVGKLTVNGSTIEAIKDIPVEGEQQQEFTLVKKAYRNKTTNNPGTYDYSDEIVAGQTVSPDEVFVYYLDIDTNPPVATVNVLDNLPPEVIFVDSQNKCSYAAANHSVVCNNVPLNGGVGFLAFRVKVKSGVADGTIIHNVGKLTVNGSTIEAIKDIPVDVPVGLIGACTELKIFKADNPRELTPDQLNNLVVGDVLRFQMLTDTNDLNGRFGVKVADANEIWLPGTIDATNKKLVKSDPYTVSTAAPYSFQAQASQTPNAQDWDTTPPDACKATGIVSPAPVGACMSMSIYKKVEGKYLLTPMTDAELQNLKVGDLLKFSVAANLNGLRARFRVTIGGVPGVWLDGTVNPDLPKQFVYTDYQVGTAGPYVFEGEVSTAPYNGALVVTHENVSNKTLEQY